MALSMIWSHGTAGDAPAAKPNKAIQSFEPDAGERIQVPTGAHGTPYR